MALIFQLDKQGQPRPKLRCDSCGGVIEDSSGGVVVWDSRQEGSGTATEPTFHCGACVRAAGGPPAGSMPIDLFVLYLVNNIQLTPGLLESAGHHLKATTTQ